MKIEECVFRHDIRIESNRESARCHLLDQIAGSSAPESSRVPRVACEACVRHVSEGLLTKHPVLPSLLYQYCENELSTSVELQTTEIDRRERLLRLRDTAEASLRKQSDALEPTNFLPSCDVILCASEMSPFLRDSIESVLEQSKVVPFLHLIDTGSAAGSFDEYKSCWNVRIYQLPPGTTSLSALHSIIKSLRGQFVAFQSTSGISDPRRLIESIRSMSDSGSELFLTHCLGQKPLVDSEVFAPGYRRRASIATWVIRCSTFVDMGGIASGFPDDDVEFLHRAIMEGRKICLGKDALVQMLAPEHLAPISEPPNYPTSRHGGLRAFATGFSKVPAACDVVLPFYGHLDFVDASLKGLLEQQSASVVIHLIDDATSEDTSDFLRKWSTHPQIRCYRNRENIGQFQSFNNVSRHFETDFCAVQDADDVSLPHRIDWSIQMLHYCEADFFAGAVELFGDEYVVASSREESESLKIVARAPIRRSFYPQRMRDEYFAENPTAVFRVSMFRNMGGFADFGDRLTNRTSVDTEFQMRCRYHSVRFALSRDVVVRYRVHNASATQDSVTGWGTKPRKDGGRQIVERRKIFLQGGFDPRSFGSIGQKSEITQRL